MQAIKQLNPVVRAVAVIGSVMALVSGATFAVMSDSAVLSDNTIGTRSATADLLLWDGDSFEPEAPGFSFPELDPGVESDEFNFYFKNNGNVDLDVTAKINVLPTFSTGITAEDVTLNFYGACSETPASATMMELFTTPLELPCNPLESGAQGVVGEDGTNNANYRVTVTIDETVEVSETGETVDAFDIVFDGNQVAEEVLAPVEE